jgi:hypothetical protein
VGLVKIKINLKKKGFFLPIMLLVGQTQSPGEGFISVIQDLFILAVPLVILMTIIKIIFKSLRAD